VCVIVAEAYPQGDLNLLSGKRQSCLFGLIRTPVFSIYLEIYNMCSSASSGKVRQGGRQGNHVGTVPFWCEHGFLSHTANRDCQIVTTACNQASGLAGYETLSSMIALRSFSSYKLCYEILNMGESCSGTVIPSRVILLALPKNIRQ
jgi:hypothetical protein